MRAFSPLTVLSVAVVAFAAPACLTSTCEAAEMGQASGRGVAAISPSAAKTMAKTLAEIQERLTAVTGVTQTEPGAVDALAHALIAARGTKENAEAVTALATAVAGVLAHSVLAEDELERLAQDFYAALSGRMLPNHDAGLLAIDITTLLQEAGAEPASMGDILTALQRVCPGAKVPPASLPSLQAAPARTLSILSRTSES